MDEASELGVSIVMLAGGEPLLSSEWLSAMSKHYEMAGIVFTNGTLLDESFAKLFAEHRHMIPVISIEGAETQTDARRGGGAHEKVIKAMSVLRSRAVPFGVSITVSSENIETVLSDDFIAEYIQKGCRLFVFVEYVPVEIRTEALALSMENKNRLSNFAGESASKHSALFIAFPGGEERFGGCLAAGRGFIHVSASGNVEPCPFAPFSDTNLKNTSLKCALNSVLLSKVRENHSLLSEGNGGCALWRNREQIIRLLGESS
jgi:MoaA/NifB/PqqE/SkfB family radical SAM enzyme